MHDAAHTIASMPGLSFASDMEPGITRRRRGRSFEYIDPNGRRVDPATRARIESIVIPPAWTEVWICPDPHGHLQAVGRDARGRKQYRYHPDFRACRDKDKFDRLGTFADALRPLRRDVEELLRGPPTEREQVLATVVALLDHGLIRVGNATYETSNGTYGATTLRKRHVRVSGRRLELEFRGKSGKIQHVELEDLTLARNVRRLLEVPGYHLFRYRDGDGWVDVGSNEVNAFVRERTKLEICSAKDFRTWGATVEAARALVRADVEPSALTKTARRGLFNHAVDQAAAKLGNTRAVCRSSYIHPVVFDAFDDGRLQEAMRRSRAVENAGRTEQAVRKVLLDSV